MIFKRILRKIFSQISGNQFNYNPPFDYVQNITMHNIHKYLNLSRYEIKRWCIVGGYLGNEVPAIIKNYPNVSVDIFECSKRYYYPLNLRYKKNKKIKIFNKAISNKIGEIEFHETSLKGSGSLLKLGNLSKESYGSKQAESFSVESITLDSFYKKRDIDVLWIDVQGAEKFVLDGANETLNRVKSVFIEVSINSGLYEDSTKIDEIINFLSKKGFYLIQLGTDINLTGNALFIKYVNLKEKH